MTTSMQRKLAQSIIQYGRAPPRPCWRRRGFCAGIGSGRSRVTFAADARTDSQCSFPSPPISFNQGCTIHYPSFVRDSRRRPRSLLLFIHPSALSLTKGAPIHHHIHSFACCVFTSEPGERGSSNAKHHIPGSDRLSQPAIPTLRVSKSPITGSLSESCELNNQHHCTTTLIPDRPSIPSHDLVLSTIALAQPYPWPVWSRVATNQLRIAFRESVATYDADSCVLVICLGQRYFHARRQFQPHLPDGHLAHCNQDCSTTV